MKPEEIKQKLEASFNPYRCVVELWDFNDRIRFRVFDKNNETIITVPEIIITNKTFNDSSLASLIKKTKEEIKKKNYAID